jgi:hypothetical protein
VDALGAVDHLRDVIVHGHARVLIGTVRRSADDLDEIAVRLERKSHPSNLDKLEF